ncbi:MAG TPA: aminopeptidase N [Burkholderiaceae bacterium]|nr:aminopeptidase N [Burkholderiaceae bacterium]
MRNEKVVTVRREDYRPPAFLVDKIELTFDLDPVSTTVEARLDVRRNPAVEGGPLVLDGENLQLLGVEVDDRALATFDLADGRLTIPLSPAAARAHVRVRNTIAPDRNTELMGLFLSHGSLFTQCEAEGFRRITFFLDRPDVMATYAVTLRADKERFPVLLANGNLVGHGDLPHGRHFARWEDPFPKPSYLFALVAGRFECREERMRTRSGRDVLLQIWVEPGQLDKTAHAMESLKRAIRWDEQRYGLEVDLDRFMIVASHDFNMGAMENKGLNIFNAKYVLANPAVATDADFANIESIVGHEYFHNWTGNRVTCRDWFQLSLKEGLTVFRDQEFSADMMLGDSAAHGETGTWARAVKRIEDVRTLRAAQFPEDAGPLAHPVRPDSYQEIGNFYTATVYEKGAEVVRMLQTILGREGFRRGLDLYFQRHDGQAVTCEDFVTAMADANTDRLDADRHAQFVRWYSQAGTPRVAVASRYDASRGTFEITLSQACPPTPGQSEKESFYVPLAIGLLAPDGTDLPLRLDGEARAGSTTRVLELTAATQTFRFVDVPVAPMPSLARDFSAPVIVECRYDDRELAFLAAHDSDGFNRWEAGQRLAVARLIAVTDAFETEQTPQLDDVLFEVFDRTLQDAALAAAFKEQALQLPAESFLAEQRAMVDPEAIRSAREYVRREIGRRLRTSLHHAYEIHLTPGPYSPDAASAGKRGLRNLALGYLVNSGAEDAVELARRQLEQADNMTDLQAALCAIVSSTAPFKVEILLRLARLWAHEPLLMNKWFNLQATAIGLPGEPPVLARVRMLLRHPAYSTANPNNVYALIGGFCNNNPAEFHRADGSGYAFWLEQVQQLDRINPTVAARIARSLDRWRKFTPDRQRRMRQVLTEVVRSPGLSRDVREIVTKSLED